MKILHSVSFALGLAFASASYAQQFAIDPLQSHIEIDIQSWVQGDAWGLIDSGSGELSVMGYDWRVETQTKRYAVSGSFELIDASLSQDSFVGVNLMNIDLQADTPLPWQLSLPAALAYNTLTGEIVQRDNWVYPCPEGVNCYVSNFIGYTPYITSLSGQRNGDELRIVGVQNRPNVGYAGKFAGEFTPPYEIPLPSDPTIRYDILATAVPEPAQYGLLLASAPLVWWASRRRRLFR